MFDARKVFKKLEGDYSLADLRLKLKQVRFENLEELGPEIGAGELLDLARSRKWIEERNGRIEIRVS